MVQSRLGLLAVGCAVWGACFFAQGQGGASNAAIGTVTVSDIPTLINQAGDFAGKIRPGVTGAQLKSQVGAMLGDPNLEGIPAGSDALVVIFGMSQALFIESTAGKAEQYAQMAGALGVAAAADKEIVIVARDAATLSAAKGMVGNVRPRLGGPAKLAGVNVLVDIPAAMRTYGPVVSSMQGMMFAQMQGMSGGGADGVKAAEQAQKVASWFLGRMQTFELAFNFVSNGLLLSTAVTPAPGTGWAELVGKPVPPMTNLIGMLPGTGATRAQYSADMAAVKALVDTEVASLVQVMGWDAKMADSVRKIFAEFDLLQGDGAMEQGAAADLSTVATVKDAKAVLDMVEKYSQADATNPWKQLQLSAMGSVPTVEFKKDSRSHQGTSVHKITTRFDLSKNPELKATFPTGGFDQEVAFVQNVQLIAPAGSAMDALIDGAKKPRNAKPLEASRLLPKGAYLYQDLDMGKMIEYGASTATGSGGKALEEQAKALAGAPPISLAAGVHGGKFVGRLLVPTGLVGKMAGGAAGDPMKAF